jgi:hypothetical protein
VLGAFVSRTKRQTMEISVDGCPLRRARKKKGVRGKFPAPQLANDPKNLSRWHRA